jgi:hypothetical protein
VQQDCDSFSLSQLPTNCFDIQALMFRLSATSWAHRVWLTEHRFAEEMYTRICEENGPADPVLQGIVSIWRVASSIWWGSDRAERWASVAADNLRSYVRDSDPFSVYEGCQCLSNTMAAIIRRTERRRKQLCTKKRRGC